MRGIPKTHSIIAILFSLHFRPDNDRVFTTNITSQSLARRSPILDRFKPNLFLSTTMFNLKSRKITRLLHVSVLWLVFSVFVAAATGTFAASWGLGPGGNERLDSGFYNLLSQTFLTLLASWCTVHPVLHNYLTKRRSRVPLPAHTVVFIFSYIATFCTAVAAPIAYARVRGQPWAGNIGNTMNFVSSFFTVVTASQLAAGVMRIED